MGEVCGAMLMRPEKYLGQLHKNIHNHLKLQRERERERERERNKCRTQKQTRYTFLFWHLFLAT